MCVYCNEYERGPMCEKCKKRLAEYKAAISWAECTPTTFELNVPSFHEAVEHAKKMLVDKEEAYTADMEKGRRVPALFLKRNGLDTTFVCKFCGRSCNKEEETTGHKNICRKCYSDIITYKNGGGSKEFKQKFEKICRSNEASGRYVPSVATKEPMVICPCCGKAPDKIPKRSMCDTCGKLESKYRTYVSRLNINPELTTVSTEVKRIETMYRIRRSKGLKVPDIFKKKNPL